MLTYMFPIISFSLFMIMHLAVWQFNHLKFKGVFLITFLSLLSWGIFELSILAYQSINMDTTLYTLCIHFFLTMLYLHFYVGVDRSVSIRILGELLKSPSQGLCAEKLDEIYPLEYMFKHRIGLLEKMGWLQCQNGVYTCQPKAYKLAKITVLLTKIYGLKITG